MDTGPAANITQTIAGVAPTGEGANLVSSYQVHGSDDLLVIHGGAIDDQIDVATDLALMALIDVEGGNDI